MSQYTTQLRWLVETNSADNQTITARCTEAAPKLFNFDFPFYEESKRLNFEVMILRHFYLYEIGMETVGLFRLTLESWLVENMPFWNLKYQAINKQFDFLDNYNYSESYTLSDDTVTSGNSSTENTGESSSTDGNMRKYYEVPSKNIVSIDDHLNNATQDTGNASANSSTTGKNNYSDTTTKDINSVTSKKGTQGQNPSKLLADYLDAIQNINYQVLDAMTDLFMGVW